MKWGQRAPEWPCDIALCNIFSSVPPFLCAISTFCKCFLLCLCLFQKQYVFVSICLEEGISGGLPSLPSRQTSVGVSSAFSSGRMNPNTKQPRRPLLPFLKGEDPGSPEGTLSKGTGMADPLDFSKGKWIIAGCLWVPVLAWPIMSYPQGLIDVRTKSSEGPHLAVGKLRSREDQRRWLRSGCLKQQKQPSQLPRGCVIFVTTLSPFTDCCPLKAPHLPTLHQEPRDTDTSGPASALLCVPESSSIALLPSQGTQTPPPR